MKHELSDFLDPSLIDELKKKIHRGDFYGVTFKHAMEFILADGVIPESGLPVESFLMLEAWVKAFSEEWVLSYSATELKNKTGEILERVVGGYAVRLHRHGRVIAEIRKVDE